MWKDQPGMTTSRLIKVLVRDQIVYFLACVCLFEQYETVSVDRFILLISVILVCMFDIVQNLTNGSETFNSALSVLANPALLSILGSRLLFNIKEAAARGLNGGMGWGGKMTISDIEFGMPSETAASQPRDEATKAEITEI